MMLVLPPEVQQGVTGGRGGGAGGVQHGGGAGGVQQGGGGGGEQHCAAAS